MAVFFIIYCKSDVLYVVLENFVFKHKKFIALFGTSHDYFA